MMEILSNIPGVMMETLSNIPGVMMEILSNIPGIMMETLSNTPGVMMETLSNIPGVMMERLFSLQASRYVSLMVSPSLHTTLSTNNPRLSCCVAGEATRPVYCERGKLVLTEQSLGPGQGRFMCGDEVTHNRGRLSKEIKKGF